MFKKRNSSVIGLQETNNDAVVPFSGNLASYPYVEYEKQESEKNEDAPKTVAGVQKLGTFAGVFVPCVLSIFGVILFERLAWIIGQAGIINFMLLLIIAYMLVVVTSMSLSAICTNGKVAGGGCYYVISRSLGPEFGGAVGLIFYLANVFGCAVYLIGFQTAFMSQFDMIPDTKVADLLTATIALLVLTTICLVGASAFAKTSIGIFVIMIISIIVIMISFMFQKSCCGDGPICDDSCPGFTSWNGKTFVENTKSHYTPQDGNPGEDYNFAIVFAIMFPAVTGIMAGANISGDLEDPSKSIPAGTFMALLFTGILYIFIAFVIAFTVQAEALVNVTDGARFSGYLIMQYVTFYDFIFSAGIFCATLSSAMSTIIGGAKILQALARDDILPFISFFKKGSQGADEPRRGVLFTAFLVQAIMLASSNLNILATFQTLFFLLSYAIVNLACLLQVVNGSPNFRPTFRYFSWHTALFGTVLCIGVMFLTNTVNAAISIFLGLVLVMYIHYKGPTTTWGDISQAIIYHQVRKYLLRLDPGKAHIKYWRPQILFFVANPRSAYIRMQFINRLKKGGMFFISEIITAKADLQEMHRVLDLQNMSLRTYINDTALKAFGNVLIAKTIRRGIQSALMSTGIGALRPNSCVFGFYDQNYAPVDSLTQLKHLDNAAEQHLTESSSMFPNLREKGEVSQISIDEYVEMIKDCLVFEMNVYILRNFEKMPYFLIDDNKPDKNLGLPAPLQMTIDLWYLPMSDQSSTNMCLFLGFILGRTKGWKTYARIRICSVISDEVDPKEELKTLEDTVTQYRIPCEDVDVFVMSDFIEEKDDGLETRRGKYEVINRIIRENQHESAISFIPMPSPLELNSHDEYVDYVEDLNVLTNETPACLLVHSNASTVMTTAV